MMNSERSFWKMKWKNVEIEFSEWVELYIEDQQSTIPLQVSNREDYDLVIG